MFCGLRFKLVFLDFVTFWMPSGATFETIFEKNTVPKIAQKKGIPYLRIPPYPRVRWLPETPPRVRTSRRETIARARILVRVQLEFELLPEFVSKFLFELIAIEKIENMERVDVKTQFLVI